MTPRAAQLLLALEPGVEYAAWEAARRAGIKMTSGVPRRCATLGPDMAKVRRESDAIYVTRRLPGYCLLTLQGTYRRDDSHGRSHRPADLGIAQAALQALDTIGGHVVALGKLFRTAFMYHDRGPSIFPDHVSRWVKIHPELVTALQNHGLLRTHAEDDLAVYLTARTELR